MDDPSQFQEWISLLGEDDFFDPFLLYPLGHQYTYNVPFLSDPLSDFPASTDSEPITPISNPPEPSSPPDFELFIIHEEPFFTLETPPADTVSPGDLTPTTLRSPDTNSSPEDSSPGTPSSPETDDSRASTSPTTPDSPAPESFEPIQMPAGDWECAFPRCLKRYRRRCDVNKHCKTHTKPFACVVCGQKSSSKRDKERHELSHRSQHPKCPYPGCPSATSRKDNLRDHIKRKHKDMDPKDPAIDALYSKRQRI